MVGIPCDKCKRSSHQKFLLSWELVGERPRDWLKGSQSKFKSRHFSSRASGSSFTLRIITQSHPRRSSSEKVSKGTGASISRMLLKHYIRILFEYSWAPRFALSIQPLFCIWVQCILFTSLCNRHHRWLMQNPPFLLAGKKNRQKPSPRFLKWSISTSIT